jgi:hypothetical protein
MKIDESWKPWFPMWGAIVRPEHGVLIQIARESWDGPVTCYRETMPPEMNGVGLFWRLTGIAKHATQGH